ncbi:alpha/beta hydrolase [Streptomyces phaeoluteigriseus]|uniref:Alpha/beta hydrolase n=1 Tax=Streptomyces phaeoluteigriseus TaxID=114686 RepID=A0ABY4ZCR5_9ACTN|nr:alpha/beta fold hydrolase [Streptomyces phaeoluteigriseus]USQ86330.1 alpha/beta hydrolase [Streptomyces phaeoluteigriseus]
MSAQQEAAGGSPAPVVTLTFVGSRAETEEATSRLPVASQAALRQFSLERMTGYGVDYADAVELRARVVEGETWPSAATELADVCLRRVEGTAGDVAPPTRVTYLRRASALLRMSQMMMLSDTAERRAIFARAAELYAQAAEPGGDRERVRIETERGPLTGWLVPAGDTPVGSAVVIGGVEGWAMDFDSLGEALAARGVDTLLLDGPGQGETRLTHGHYLTARWPDAYERAVDLLDERSPGRPIAFVGNSMGGSVAMAVAAQDVRIRACVDNGGIHAPWLVPPTMGTFFSKMVAACGTEDPDRAVDVWKTVTPLADGPNADYPLLVVQGGADPMVSMDLARILLQGAPTDDKRMVVFSDGNHCVYNHKLDRDALVADWTTARLRGLPGPEIAK